MSLIYILLILLAFLSYSKRHFSLFIKLFVTLVSGGFAIFPETILKVTDCLLILLVLNLVEVDTFSHVKMIK